MQKISFSRFAVQFFAVISFSSCSSLLGGNKTECSCFYFDVQSGTIASDCSFSNCGGEKITSIRADIQPLSNVEFNTSLLDSSFATPSYTFSTTLSAAALTRVKARGISIMAYTQRSDVWFTLRAGPAELSSRNRFYFTRNH